MGFLSRKQKAEFENISTLVIKSQSGDKEAREILLKQYTPFILRVLSNCCGRFIRMGEDDEASIGLLAFNEAIDKYSFDKNTKFLTFAELVIKRRLTDFYRKEKRIMEKTVCVSICDNENQDIQIAIEKEQAEKAYQLQQEELERRSEIINFSKKLALFNITMSDLVKVAPKHYDARCRAFEAAKVIAEDKSLELYLFEKKALPLKSLEERVAISRKTLERQRKYIIALTIVLTENFIYLKSYLNFIGKEDITCQ